MSPVGLASPAAGEQFDEIVTGVEAPRVPAGSKAATGSKAPNGSKVPRRTPSRQPGNRRAAPAPLVDRATRHIPRGTAVTAPQGASFRRAASRVTVVGAILFAAGLVVSTSLPAQALYNPDTDATAALAPGAAVRGQVGQVLSVGATTDGETGRDAYTVSERVQQPVRTDPDAFSNDASGSIQWPFPTGVPITSGFGGRQVAGCSFCSTFHQGIDFAPGSGTPIHVVADGTVIKVQANDGGFGNDVWVQHDVDGKQFVSVYGHMLDNSFTVVQGQRITVGTVVGAVGSTGNSTGPHLHLEIHVNDVPVDPLAWLEANAN